MVVRRRYSPVAVFLFAPLTWAGEAIWRLLHFLALLGLPGWLRWIALASYPFWFDVHAGNVLIFVTVLAFWALRGSRLSIGATFILALLIPRPLAVPIVIWLLWKHPKWRLPFAGLVVVHALAVLISGYGDEWIATLIHARGDIDNVLNVAPSAILGWWWIVIAIPLSLWTLRRGWPALAGLLLQPYWLPYYLLLPLADHCHGKLSSAYSSPRRLTSPLIARRRSGNDE